MRAANSLVRIKLFARNLARNLSSPQTIGDQFGVIARHWLISKLNFEKFPSFNVRKYLLNLDRWLTTCESQALTHQLRSCGRLKFWSTRNNDPHEHEIWGNFKIFKLETFGWIGWTSSADSAMNQWWQSVAVKLCSMNNDKRWQILQLERYFECITDHNHSVQKFSVKNSMLLDTERLNLPQKWMTSHLPQLISRSDELLWWVLFTLMSPVHFDESCLLWWIAQTSRSDEIVNADCYRTQ